MSDRPRLDPERLRRARAYRAFALWTGNASTAAGVAIMLGQRMKFYVARTSPEDLVYLRDLVESGKLRPVIDRTYPLSGAREAVRYDGSGQARAKVVITA